MNKWDKITYEYYLKRSPQVGEINDEMLEIVHWLYTRAKVDNPKLQALENIQRVKHLVKSSTGNIIKSVENAGMISGLLNQTDDDVDPSDDESMASFQNQFLKAGFKEAAEKLGEAQNQMDLLGLGQGHGGDVSHEMPDDEEFAAREKLMRQVMTSKRFKAVVDMFGHIMTHVAEVKRRRVMPDPTNMAHTELGSSIKDVVFAEYINMAVPELETLFNLRLAQNSLVQYKREKPREVGKGDFTLLIDCSGSMSGYSSVVLDGYQLTRMDAAVAFAIAATRIMLNDNRHVRCYVFTERCTKFFDTRAVSFGQIIEMLSRLSASGGTVFEGAIESWLSGDDEDDCVMITDSEGDMSNREARLLKDNKGERRLGVLKVVNSFWGSPNLEDVADAYISGDDAESFKLMSEELIRE